MQKTTVAAKSHPPRSRRPRRAGDRGDCQTRRQAGTDNQKGPPNRCWGGLLIQSKPSGSGPRSRSAIRRLFRRSRSIFHGRGRSGAVLATFDHGAAGGTAGTAIRRRTAGTSVAPGGAAAAEGSLRAGGRGLAGTARATVAHGLELRGLPVAGAAIATGGATARGTVPSPQGAPQLGAQLPLPPQAPQSEAQGAAQLAAHGAAQLGAAQLVWQRVRQRDRQQRRPASASTPDTNKATAATAATIKTRRIMVWTPL